LTTSRKTRAWIGTSGWTYDAWADGFYAGVPRAKWFEHYVRHFDAVEVNATFYHALKPATFAHWREGAQGFGSTIRHALRGIKRLEVDSAVIDRARAPAAKLGASSRWWCGSCPRSSRDRPPRASSASSRAGRTAARGRFGILWFEPRSSVRWRCGHRERDIRCGRLAVARRSDDGSCARLHGHTATYSSAYGGRALAAWAGASGVARGGLRNVCFDNTDAGRASDAAILRDLLSRDG
jgi:hypothetical protein